MIAIGIILIGIFKGIFGKSHEGYEIELKTHDANKLDNVLDIIHKRTGMRKPNKIILVEGSEIAVSGLYRKKLIIGLATLQFLDEKELLAIISHEYGHFSNKDTVLGYFSYRIMKFIEIQKAINRESLGADWTIIIHLPTWIFFLLFSRYYALISLWYARRVEYRADKFAIEIVGEKNFADSFVKYCAISEIFEDTVPRYVLHYLQEDKAIKNIYDFARPLYNKENIEKSFESCLAQKSSWWSSHPSISERLEAMGVDFVNIEISQNNGNILKNQEKYEKEASMLMTEKMAYWQQLVRLAEQQGGSEQ